MRTVLLLLCLDLALMASSQGIGSLGRNLITALEVSEEALSNMGKRMTALIRYRIGRRTDSRKKKEICYQFLGCFPADRPLKKGPQSPSDIETKFFLYTRTTSEELIAYGDDRSSLKASNFRPERPTKFLVHGFKGSGRDKGAKLIASSLLNIEDCNVILLDWEKGAAGPSYQLSAANTQLVGRQLTLVLLDLISLGSSPSSIHIIGFSLGAHIAGFAGRSLVDKGIRLARITGLDPASPLFREHLRSSMPALNDQDAALVDVIHTDGAIVWTEGFGLLKALGHVDFFPNGGQDQPGCAHVFASVIVSHLEGTVNSSTVCNHIRGFQLFLESIPLSEKEPKCQFKAFPCQTRDHFRSGSCFPHKCDIDSRDGSCGVMGYSANKGLARGQLYLVTRDSPPFCGDQLQATVTLSRPIPRPRGILQLHLHHADSTTIFKLSTEWVEAAAQQARQLVLPIRSYNGPAVTYRGLAAAPYESMPNNLNETSVTILYKPLQAQAKELNLFYVRIASLDGHSWTFCGREPFDESYEDREVGTIRVNLTLGLC